MSAVHYAGALRLASGKSGVLIVLGGYAACCWGPRAQKIADEGRHTHDRHRVTCKRCLARIAAHDAYAAREKAGT